MKAGKKTIALILALVFVIALGAVAAADDAPTKGTITIERESAHFRNENGYEYDQILNQSAYDLYRIFDATMSFDEEGNPTAVSYTCTDAQKALEGFSTYFVVDDANNVLGVTEAGGSEAGLSPEAVQWIKANIASLGTRITEVSESTWKGSYYNSDPNVPYYTVEYDQTYNPYARKIWHNLPFGYYFIDSNVGSAVMIDTTKPSATIQDKNETPRLDKVITKVTNQNGEEQTTADHSPWITSDGKNALAQIGDTVSYEATIHAKFGAEQYIFSDSMDWSLTLDVSSISITVDGNPLDPSNFTLLTDVEGRITYDNVTDYFGLGSTYNDSFTPIYKLETATPNDWITIAHSYWWDSATYQSHNTDANIVIVFHQDYLDTITEDTDIVVTYNAVLNEHAGNGSEVMNDENMATLNYGHRNWSISDWTKVQSLQLVVFKYEGSEASSSAGSKPLNGVRFLLAREDGLYFKQDPTTRAITWVERSDATELVTANQMIWIYTGTNYYEAYQQVPMDGYIVVDGLTGGTYTLIEIEPLPGYNRISDITFSMPNSMLPIPQNSPAFRTQVNIANNTGTLLPSTGGEGVTAVYVCGLTVLLGAAALLLSKKRNGNKA